MLLMMDVNTLETANATGPGRTIDAAKYMETVIARPSMGEGCFTRILIPTKHVNALYINRDEFKKIGFDIVTIESLFPYNGPEEVVVIRAPFGTTIQIIGIILNFYQKSYKGQCDLRLLYHDNLIGFIIGQQGHKIRELRQKYKNSKLKIYSSLAPLSTDKIVRIINYPDKIIQTIRDILKIIRNKKILKTIQNYNPMNFSCYFAHEYGGYGCGPMCKDTGMNPYDISNNMLIHYRYLYLGRNNMPMANFSDRFFRTFQANSDVYLISFLHGLTFINTTYLYGYDVQHSYNAIYLRGDTIIENDCIYQMEFLLPIYRSDILNIENCKRIVEMSNVIITVYLIDDNDSLLLTVIGTAVQVERAAFLLQQSLLMF